MVVAVSVGWSGNSLPIICATVGQMTGKMIREYLEHHFEPNPDDQFRMELD